jgi:hypothetical protein
MSDKSVVGDLINFRGLVYAPVNENGVVFLFGKMVEDLNMYVEEIKPGFPDCIARRFVGKGWERVSIEFEYKSSNFVQHGHDPNGCDLIVCWEHDWKDCPIEIIELKTEIIGLVNRPISRPGKPDIEGKEITADIDNILQNVGAVPDIKKWYVEIFDRISAIDNSIWEKVGTKYIGWYSPQKAFVSLKLKRLSIRFECFSRGQPLEGGKVSNIRFSPRWAKFTVKLDADVEIAVNILSESLKRIKEAIEAGETTGYYSGGEGFNSVSDENEKDEEA